LVLVQRLVISLVFRFWGHDGTFESNHFFETKKEDDDDNNINKQPNNKGEKAKGGWGLCYLFISLSFVLW
jgi:hypothetical protein